MMSRNTTAATATGRKLNRKMLSHETTNNSPPTTSGPVMSPKLAPTPLTARANARRSGKRVDRKPIAGGCQSAPAMPSTAAKATSTGKLGESPTRKKLTPNQASATAMNHARCPEKRSARTPMGALARAPEKERAPITVPTASGPSPKLATISARRITNAWPNQCTVACPAVTVPMTTRPRTP